VARLRELLAEKSDHTGGQAGRLLRETLTATPWLLAVVGQFQEGDADRLDLLIINEQQRWTDERWQAAIDCLRRMLAAARIMEGEE
jgi:hypothetical protein